MATAKPKDRLDEVLMSLHAGHLEIEVSKMGTLDWELMGQMARAASAYLKENSPLHSDEGRKLQARLLRDAAAEIDNWRSEAQQLAAYKDHTERMLALFEAQPQRSPGVYAGEEPDISYRLRTCAEGFEQPPKEV